MYLSPDSATALHSGRHIAPLMVLQCQNGFCVEGPQAALHVILDGPRESDPPDVHVVRGENGSTHRMGTS